MQMKFYSPLTADFFPNEPDYEDEFYDEYEGCPLDGHELLEYETAIRDAVENDTRDFGGDLMQYYHEDDSVRGKVVTAIPSVEVHGNKLCGCLTVELKEPLLDDELTASAITFPASTAMAGARALSNAKSRLRTASCMSISGRITILN